MLSATSLNNAVGLRAFANTRQRQQKSPAFRRFKGAALHLKMPFITRLSPAASIAIFFVDEQWFFVASSLCHSLVQLHKRQLLLQR